MSRTFHLNKLVRDGIVPSMLKMAQKPVYRKLSEEERIAALKTKILEEGGEVDLPDLLEIIESLAEAEGKTFDEIREKQLTKRAKIGGFKEGTYVGTLTLEENDEWVKYYAAEPERFPEVDSE